MDKISILIVDDHGLVRQGLQAYLGVHEDLQIVGEARNGIEAVALVGRYRPDIVLMDLVMPEMDGVEATRQITAMSGSSKVIVLTSFSEDEQVFPAIRAGASGYLLKDVTPKDLSAAIRAVHRGETTLHPDITRKLLNQFVGLQREPISDAADLTPRELEVLRLIAQGLSNRDVAEALVISEKTVKAHVSHILSKLHLEDRTQAAIYAYKHGLVDT